MFFLSSFPHTLEIPKLVQQPFSADGFPKSLPERIWVIYSFLLNKGLLCGFFLFPSPKMFFPYELPGALTLKYLVIDF